MATFVSSVIISGTEVPFLLEYKTPQYKVIPPTS